MGCISSSEDPEPSPLIQQNERKKLIEPNQSRLLKILLTGNSGTGKSCLLLRYTGAPFQEKFVCTLGVDFKIKTVELGNELYKLQIWDTAGQEKFRSLLNSYYRDSNGVFLVYSVSNRASFEDIQQWNKDCDKWGPPDTKKMLIATKTDLAERVVASNEGENLAREIGIKFMETSSRNYVNIEEMFTEIVMSIEGRD